MVVKDDDGGFNDEGRRFMIYEMNIHRYIIWRTIFLTCSSLYIHPSYQSEVGVSITPVCPKHHFLVHRRTLAKRESLVWTNIQVAGSHWFLNWVDIRNRSIHLNDSFQHKSLHFTTRILPLFVNAPNPFTADFYTNVSLRHSPAPHTTAILLRALQRCH